MRISKDDALSLLSKWHPHTVRAIFSLRSGGVTASVFGNISFESADRVRISSSLDKEENCFLEVVLENCEFEYGDSRESPAKTSIQSVLTMIYTDGQAPYERASVFELANP